MSNDCAPAPEACPIDLATRRAWLEKTRPPRGSTPGDPGDLEGATLAGRPTMTTPTLFSRIFAPWPAPPPERRAAASLCQERVVSTIPRAAPSPDADVAHARPANSEQEGGTSHDGKWVYPSEKMFFEAMRRKGYSTEAKDMKTVVPIHNAVNERAWKEIKEWEKPWVDEETSDEPKLLSFSGMSNSLTPKARFNTWLGYVAPFDRHDWMVDRSGKKVEYVIDFYAGKDLGNDKLNFYLDVRPKLNSWEGWKIRTAKILGLV